MDDAAKIDTVGAVIDLDHLAELCRPFGTALEQADGAAVILVSDPLLLLELCQQEGVFAGLGQFCEVLLHASLDAPSSGLDVRAFFLGVGFAGLGYRHIADQRGLAGRGELAEMFLDARFEPALTRFNLAA
jgi:hypothetical protein